ncbi:unnamed protein product [Auanema sp. JU1783]|nr:unnamed protein product [Auanema sp. JU1783]
MASTSAISSGIFNQPVDSEPNPLEENRYARFVIHSNHKVFSRAITSLSKLGVDLYIEPNELGLSIKTFNKTKSAYGLFQFSSEFFSEVDASIFSEDESSNRLCRISMKCALSLFKGLQFSEKTFVSCEFRIDPSSDFFIVQLLYAYDVSKTFEINLLETQTSFRTTVDKTTLQNLTIVTPSILHAILHSLGSSEEMIIQSTENELILKNYLAHDDDNRRIVKTQAKLSTTHLERHNSVISTEIAVSLKEFMAVLTFADQNNAILSLYYDVPGKPLVVALEGDIVYSAEFIIATVEAENPEVHEHREITTQQISRHNSQTSRNSTRRSRISIPGPSQPRITALFPQNTVASPQQSLRGREPPLVSTPNVEVEVQQEETVEEEENVPQVEAMEEVEEEVYEDAPDIPANNEEADVINPSHLTVPSQSTTNALVTQTAPVVADIGEMNEITNVSLYPDPAPMEVDEQVEKTIMNEEVEDLPDTPPPSDQRHILFGQTKPDIKENKKIRTNSFRRFFLGGEMATQHESQKMEDKTVLAEDTDGEWD